MRYFEDLQWDCHALAVQKGFWDDRTEESIPTMLALIHSEVSEALEEYRNHRMGVIYGGDGKPDGFPVELADIVIRVLDMAEGLNIRLSDRIREKLDYNWTRPHRHGGKRI